MVKKKEKKHTLTVPKSSETPKKNKCTPTHITIKLVLKTEYRENLERSQKEPKTHSIKLTTIRIAMGFSETMEAKRQKNNIFKVIKEKLKTCQLRYFTVNTQRKHPSKMRVKHSHF